MSLRFPLTPPSKKTDRSPSPTASNHSFFPKRSEGNSQQVNKPRIFTEKEIADIDRAAYQYAKSVPFRTYYLSTQSDQLVFDTQTDLHYYATGCQGNASNAQKAVANLLQKNIRKNHQQRPLVFLTGDNVYDAGTSCPSDRGMKDCFENIYDPRALYFVAAGNHDENIHRLSLPNSETGIPVLLNQVAYTYAQHIKKYLSEHRNHSIKQAVEHLKNIFEKQIHHPQFGNIYILNVNELLPWNMLSPAYSIVAGNIQFFILNSNHLGEDFSDYQTGAFYKTGHTNQIQEFVSAYKHATEVCKRNPMQINLIMHHNVKTVGSRAYKKDFHLYCEDADKRKEIYKALNLDVNAEHSNHEVVDAVLKNLKTNVNQIICAHDHYNSLASTHENNTYYKASFGLGGGGGSLQDRNDLNPDLLAFFSKSNGYGEFTAKHATGDYSASIHTTHKDNHDEYTMEHCYQFDSNNITTPVRIYPQGISQKERGEIEKICAVVKDALDNYFNFLSKQISKDKQFIFKNLSHGHEGIDRAHYLWNYISRNQADNYETTLDKIHQIVTHQDEEILHKAKEYFGWVNKNSLIYHLNTACNKEGIANNFEELWKNREKLFKEEIKSNYHMSFVSI